MPTATSDYLNLPCRSVAEVLRARAERTAVQSIPSPSRAGGHSSLDPLPARPAPRSRRAPAMPPCRAPWMIR